MTTPMLSAKGVVRRFGGLTAVAGVSFDVQPGEIFGLIGPNGAGKSTMLNLIAGLSPVSAGEILYKGQSISQLPAQRRSALGIGRTFQIPQPLHDLTVRENVAVGALFGRRDRHYTMAEALGHAEAVLAEVGLAAQGNTPVEHLNLAQRKRLELARALATDPELLLLDEVMGGLNHTEVAAVMELVQRLNARGVTIIVVEHIMKVIMNICHRILVMHLGARIAGGTPAEIATDPKVVEAYLGARYAAARHGTAPDGVAATREDGINHA